MSEKLSIKDLDIDGKTVIMRVDFNIPQDKDLNITDDTRIKKAIDSIKYILDKNGALILMSHLGRPKGKKEERYSLLPCAKRLEELLQVPVKMAPDCIGDEVKELVDNIKPQEIVLLENLRFHAAEEKPDSDFAKQLAGLADLYVNEAFGAAHRKHSSTYTIASYFPGKGALGFLMEKEIAFLGEAFQNPKRPFHAIIGGAKVSSKIGALKALIDKVDSLMIAGAMANTFLKVKGYSIGSSLYEKDYLKLAEEIIVLVKKKGIELLLPIDVCVAQEIADDAIAKYISIDVGVEADFQALDIGPMTIEACKKMLDKAQTIFWNGPVGVTEIPVFAKGTIAIANMLAKSKAITIIGGGDSVAAINSLNLADQIDHISTGGGASLEYIEKGQLPGIEALSLKKT